MDIVVLCGGLSPERGVSFSSAAMITAALKKRGHRVVPLDMYLGLQDYEGNINDIFSNPPLLSVTSVASEAPDLEAVKQARRSGGDSLLGEGVLRTCEMADVVFIAMHGACGEDGRIQAALELLGIPYTGSGPLPSAISLAKGLTKHLVASAGFRTPDYRVCDTTNLDIDEIVRQTELPCVVKPDDAGSSIGINLIFDRESLRGALSEAASVSGKIVIERYIKGRELTVGVLGGAALPSVEIITPGGWYDYKFKYQPGRAIEICPAEIPSDLEEKLRKISLSIHELMGLSAYSRSDFILDESGEIWFLEVNTLPGMTPTSLIPQEAAAVGICYEDLCEKIIELALLERGKTK